MAGMAKKSGAEPKASVYVENSRRNLRSLVQMQVPPTVQQRPEPARDIILPAASLLEVGKRGITRENSSPQVEQLTFQPSIVEHFFSNYTLNSRKHTRTATSISLHPKRGTSIGNSQPIYSGCRAWIRTRVTCARDTRATTTPLGRNSFVTSVAVTSAILVVGELTVKPSALSNPS